MRGDTPEEVGDEKSAVVSTLFAGIEVMDRRRRTVDIGLDLLPQLRGALLVRLQRLFIFFDGFERPLAPLAELLVLVAVGVVRLLVTPVVEARTTGNEGAGYAAFRGPDAGEVALVVREVLLALLLRHGLKVCVQLPLVHGDLVFTDNIGILRAPVVGIVSGLP